MDIRWIQNARAVFVRLYGEKRGLRVCDAVLPGVTADFRRMLAAAGTHVPVRETYRTDDGRTELRLEGLRTDAGPVLTRLTIGGAAVELGDKELPL
ncbi:MAG: hypothetical protein IKD79_05110 [Oscillospiraceae bacterium]|nr:hypothetical protein [Oscillospiraceae bacterium]